MNIFIQKNKLLPALDMLQNIIVKNTTRIRETTKIKFTVAKNNTIITATDLEAEVNKKIPCVAPVEEEIQFMVDYAQLKKIIKTFDVGNVSMKVADNILNIEQNGFTHQINIESAENFPTVCFEKRNPLKIKTKELIDILEKTQPFICADNTRKSTRGVYFTNEDGKFVCVATDGFTIVKYTTNLLSDMQCIVPEKHLKILLKILKKVVAEYVTIDHNKNMFLCSCDVFNYKITCIDRQFVNYRVFTDKTEFEYKVILTEEMAKNIKKMTVIQNMNKNVIYTNIVINKNTMTFNISSGEAQHTFKKEFTLAHPCTAPFEINVNLNFLDNIIKINSKDISYQLKCNTDATINIHASDKNNVLFCVSPVIPN